MLLSGGAESLTPSLRHRDFLIFSDVVFADDGLTNSGTHCYANVVAGVGVLDDGADLALET